VAKTHFKQLFSSKKRGITFVRRFSSSKVRSNRFVVRIALRCTTGQQMDQTCLQILTESLHCRRVEIPLLLQYLCRQRLPCFISRSPIDGINIRLHLRNCFRRKLGHNVTHLMDQTSLPQTFGPHLLDGTDQSRSPIGSDGHRRLQTSLDHIPQQIPPVLIRFLIAQHQMEQNPMTISGDPPGRQEPFLREW